MFNIFKHKSIQYGIPFFIFIIGGSFGLREFQDLRFKYKRGMQVNLNEEAESRGIVMKKKEEVTLESEYEKMKDKDFTNWENKRIPRPWDETLT